MEGRSLKSLTRVSDVTARLAAHLQKPRNPSRSLFWIIWPLDKHPRNIYLRIANLTRNSNQTPPQKDTSQPCVRFLTPPPYNATSQPILANMGGDGRSIPDVAQNRHQTALSTFAVFNGPRAPAPQSCAKGSKTRLWRQGEFSGAPPSPPRNVRTNTRGAGTKSEQKPKFNMHPALPQHDGFYEYIHP